MKPYPIVFPLMLALTAHATAIDGLKPNGQWKGNVSAAVSATSGGTTSESVNLSVDAARRTRTDKLSLSAEFFESRSETTTNGVTTSTTTAYQGAVAARYDRNITDDVFAFGGLEFSHDQIRLLAGRSVVSAGLGYHVIKDEDDQWDLLGGLSHRVDRYMDPGVLIGDELRASLVAPELMLGEESSHKLTESTRFKQKLVLNQNIGRVAGTRATFDSGLQVALNKTMSLSLKIQKRYDSLAQAPARKVDTLFFTGINVRFGG